MGRLFLVVLIVLVGCGQESTDPKSRIQPVAQGGARPSPPQSQPSPPVEPIQKPKVPPTSGVSLQWKDAYAIDLMELVLTETGAWMGPGKLDVRLYWSHSTAAASFVHTDSTENYWEIADGEVYWPKEHQGSQSVLIPIDQLKSGIVEFELEIEDYSYVQEVLVRQTIRFPLTQADIQEAEFSGEYVLPPIPFVNGQYGNSTDGRVVFKIFKR